MTTIRVDRMELEDEGSPQGLAARIHHWNPGLSPPVPVEAIAAACGISEVVDVDTDAYVGLLITDDAKSEGKICVSSRSPRGRRRFTIAHELGHFLLAFHDAKAQCSAWDMVPLLADDSSKRREAEANQFAAHLLLPQRRFGKDLDQRDPDVRRIVELAERYEASLEATANRAIDVTAHRLALVMGHAGTVRYVRRTKEFPWVDLKPGQPLVGRAATAWKSLEPRTATEWEPADPDDWLSRNLPRGFALYEQSYLQMRDYQLTLLSVEAEDGADDDEDDHDALVSSWTPRFRR